MLQGREKDRSRSPRARSDSVSESVSSKATDQGCPSMAMSGRRNGYTERLADLVCGSGGGDLTWTSFFDEAEEWTTATHERKRFVSFSSAKERQSFTTAKPHQLGAFTACALSVDLEAALSFHCSGREHSTTLYWCNLRPGYSATWQRPTRDPSTIFPADFARVHGLERAYRSPKHLFSDPRIGCLPVTTVSSIVQRRARRDWWVAPRFSKYVEAVFRSREQFHASEKRAHNEWIGRFPQV